MWEPPKRRPDLALWKGIQVPSLRDLLCKYTQVTLKANAKVIYSPLHSSF